jgi:hypothetical protein
MQEIWKPITGYEGYYEVSNHGKVRSVARIIHKVHSPSGTVYQWCKPSMILNSNRGGHNYLRVDLCVDYVAKTHYVHRLVAETFIPNPDDLPEINHMDEDRHNNHVDNLEWCSRIYNQNYGTVVHRIRETSARTRGRAVVQMDLNGNQIQVFSAVREASRQTGVNTACIWQVCNGKRKTAHGFTFKFA